MKKNLKTFNIPKELLRMAVATYLDDDNLDATNNGLQYLFTNRKSVYQQD